GFGAIRRSCWPIAPPRDSRSLKRTEEGHMRLGIACDHGGLALKEDLLAGLRGAGHEIVDFGAYALNPGDDYPDFVIPLAHAVAAGAVERGGAGWGGGGWGGGGG